MCVCLLTSPMYPPGASAAMVLLLVGVPIVLVLLVKVLVVAFPLSSLA